MFTRRLGRSVKWIRKLLGMVVRRIKSIYSNLDCQVLESKEIQSVKREAKKCSI
jgi:hypothetical protein